MSLQTLLQLNENRDDKKQGISEQRLKNSLESLRRLIAFFKWYPDLFVDIIKGPDSTLKLKF